MILQVVFGEKSEILNESIGSSKITVECDNKTTQTEALKDTAQSETYLIIEEFTEDANDNCTVDPEVLQQDETPHTKVEISEEIPVRNISKIKHEEKTPKIDTTYESKSKKKFDRFDCYVCQKKLSGNFEFLKHFSVSHPKDEVKYQCYICNGFVKKYRSYTRHIEGHVEKRFECDICNLKFSQKITLVTHLSSHSNLKKFECVDCKVSFKQNSSLFKHRKQKHSNDVPICTECNRSFVNKETYQQHLKSKHNQQMKDVNCMDCDKKFASKSALSYHRLSNHSKDKSIDLKCGTCFEEFKNKIILTRHKKKCMKSA